MTVGKIYCAKLIYENYRNVKKQNKKPHRIGNGTTDIRSDALYEDNPKSKSTLQLNLHAPTTNGMMNRSTPNLNAINHQIHQPVQREHHQPPHSLSHSTRSLQNIQNDMYNGPPQPGVNHIPAPYNQLPHLIGINGGGELRERRSNNAMRQNDGQVQSNLIPPASAMNGHHQPRGISEAPLPPQQLQQQSSQKHQIALAIRTGKNPYDMYGIPDAQEDDDWC